MPQDIDYVPTKADLAKCKDNMDKCAEAMKAERLENEDLIPKDVHGEQIEIVKEQIIDLNDKFDFLISLMIKSQKLGV